MKPEEKRELQGLHELQMQENNDLSKVKCPVLYKLLNLLNAKYLQLLIEEDADSKDESNFHYSTYSEFDSLEIELRPLNLSTNLEFEQEVQIKEEDLQTIKSSGGYQAINEKLYNEWKQCYLQYYSDVSFNIRNDNEEYIKNNLLVIKSLPLNAHSLNEKINKKRKILPIIKTPFKKTIVLDLDKTLIYCDFKYNYPKHDKYILATLDGVEYMLPIIFRPNLIRFLQFASSNFEVIVFTSSDKAYSNIILDDLDPDNTIFTHRFYRDSCINLFGKMLTKPLMIFGNRELKDMIIVDNSIYKFALNLHNGYLVPTFYDDSYDVELLKLEHFLKNHIISCQDVRKVKKMNL